MHKPLIVLNMKRLIALTIFIGLFCLQSYGQIQSNILTGKIADFGIHPRAGLTLRLSITKPINRTINGIFISNDPIETTPDSGGNFSFTNIQNGIHRFSANDSSGSYWTVTITNTAGNWPLAALVTTITPSFSNPGTNYFTQSQSLALFTQQIIGAGNIYVINNYDGTWTIYSTNGATGGGSGGSLWTSLGGSIYPNGSTGTNSGWASSGGSIYPQ